MARTVKDALNSGSRTDLPQLLGRMNIGSLLEAIVTPKIDSVARTNITSHVSLLVDADGNAQHGTIDTVEATAGSVTGACLKTIGTPATHQVKVEYVNGGQPKLTFNSGDAVTGYKVTWIEHPLSRNNVTLQAELASGAA